MVLKIPLRLTVEGPLHLWGFELNKIEFLSYLLPPVTTQEYPPAPYQRPCERGSFPHLQTTCLDHHHGPDKAWWTRDQMVEPFLWIWNLFLKYIKHFWNVVIWKTLCCGWSLQVNELLLETFPYKVKINKK